MIELALFVICTTILPVLINKSTEDKRFDWLKPYLREVWTAIFLFFAWYYLMKPEVVIQMSKWRSLYPGVLGYILAATVGGLALCAYWWFVGQVLHPSKPADVIPKALSFTPEHGHRVDPNLYAVLQEIDRTITQKNEIELRQTFDLPDNLKFNILYAKQRFFPDLFSAIDAQQVNDFFKGGQALIDTRYADMTSVNFAARYEPHKGQMGLINLSTKYVSARNTLAHWFNSSQVPLPVANAIRELDNTVESNMKLVIQAINDSYQLRPESISKNDVYGSEFYGSASGLYWENFVHLRPKAEAVGKEIYPYLHKD